MKISKKATTIAIVNQKGGTGKTTTCENLGIGLAMETAVRAACHIVYSDAESHERPAYPTR